MTVATGNMLRIAPKASTSAYETHSSLVVSQTSITGDVVYSADVTTLQQLRTGSAANPWETAWIVWNYTDNQHFYYFALKTNGWELGKVDPTYAGGQRFLATGSDLKFAIGQWYNVEVRQTGNTISIAVDGKQITSFVDNLSPYLGGKIGIYTEDAAVAIDNITGSIKDTFDGYAATTLKDGSLIGSQWLVPFLGYGSGSIAAVNASQPSATQTPVQPTTTQPTTTQAITHPVASQPATSQPAAVQPAPSKTIVDGLHFSGAVVGTGSVVIDGTATTGATVSALESRKVVGSSSAGSDGHWQLVVSASEKSTHTYQITLNGAAQPGVVVIGTKNADVLIGGAGDDLIVGGKGNDTLSGGSGHDVFQFEAGAGKDRIVDFKAKDDTIRFVGGSLHSLADVLASSTFAGNELLIRNGSDTVSLVGIHAADLTAANFTFG